MKFGDREFPYSFSQNRVYNDCPRKYKFKYVDGLEEPSNDNLDLGNAIHKILEIKFWEKGNIERVEEIDKAINYIIDKRGTQYFVQLLNDLELFFKDKEILHTELCIEDKDFICKIDVVYKDKDGRIILADYKVTKKPKTALSVYDEGQLLFYKYKFAEKYPEINWDNILVQYINILSYLSHTIVTYTIPINLSTMYCEYFYESMKKNIEKINNKEFPKKEKWCNWCYFKDICNN